MTGLPHSEQDWVSRGAVRVDVVCAECGDPFPCGVFTEALAQRAAARRITRGLAHD